MERNDHNIQYVLLLAIAFVSIVPTFGFGGIVVGGIHLTLYRVIVPTAFLCFILVNRLTISSFCRRPFIYWIALLVVWIVIGVLLLAISTYSDKHAGILEIISLVYGLVLIGMFSQYEMNERELDIMFFLVRLLLIILIVIGFAEIVTGQHLPTSFYFDEDRALLNATNPYMATGIMHNVNDFSALITCLLPACLYKSRKAAALVCTCLVVVINSVNDATICNFAIIIGATYYLASKIKSSLHYRDFSAVILAIIVTTTAFLFIEAVLQLVMGYGISRSVAAQASNYAAGRGSFALRVGAYTEAVLSAVDSMFLGIGPAGFTNYCMINNAPSGVLNPHSLLFEVLSEYGIVVVLMLLYAMLKTAGLAVFNKSDFQANSQRVTAIEFLLLLLVVSFAPSTFIGFSYTWLVIALVCCLLSNTNCSNNVREVI